MVFVFCVKNRRGGTLTHAFQRSEGGGPLPPSTWAKVVRSLRERGGATDQPRVLVDQVPIPHRQWAIAFINGFIVPQPGSSVTEAA
jgi:hypothetical protein